MTPEAVIITHSDHASASLISLKCHTCPGGGRRASAEIGTGAARCRAGVAAAWWVLRADSADGRGAADWSGLPVLEAGPPWHLSPLEKPSGGVLTLTGRAVTGSPGALGRSDHVSRRAACRPERARRPGWSSCRRRSARCQGGPAGLELAAQDVGESAFAGFDDGAGVVGGEPAQHGARRAGCRASSGRRRGRAGP
jgi:hypothetical protein